MLRVCYIGFGRISGKHLAAINSKENKKNFKIVGIAENKKNFKLKSKKIKLYQNYIKMVKELKPDLTIILTDNGSHYKHFINTSKFCKNFLIEKPICLNTKQIRLIKKYQKKNQNEIFVVKQNRYNKAMIYLDGLLKKKSLGKIFFYDISVKWKRTVDYYKKSYWHGSKKLDGSVIANQGSHHLDLIISFFGKPTKIQYLGTKFKKFVDFDDTVSLNLKHKKNILGNIRVTTAAEPKDIEGKLSIMGSKGFIRIGGHQLNNIEMINVKNKNIKKRNLIKNSEKIGSNVYGNNHSKVYSFVNKLIKNPDNKKNIQRKNNLLKDAFSTVEIFEKI